MMDIIGDWLSKLQVGTVSGWMLVALVLIAWWKGLPQIITAIANRQSKIEERLGNEMDAMSARWTLRLEEADEQHAKCMAGQEALRARITAQDSTIATQNETIAKQSGTIVNLSNEIAGLRASNVQQQIALVESGAPSDAMKKAIVSLKEVK